MDVNEQFSVRRSVAIVVAVVLGVLLLPVGVQAAAPTLMQLVDGDGASKAQVDSGRVRVGDGTGPLTVDGKVRVTGTTTTRSAVLLESGYCGPLPGASQETTETLPVGAVVTSIVFTGPVGNYPGSRLDIFPGTDTTDQKTALMSLKTNLASDNGGTQNAIYASDAGFRITGTEPWTVACGGQVKGNGHNGALYSIFGYPPK